MIITLRSDGAES